MNDDREPRDPALDALLGEHSTETPPAHIDAAILAAAHRAVDHRPRPARATQAWRWWMPLAAAAMIGLVVVGVLPLAPSIVTQAPPTVTDVPPSSGVPVPPDAFHVPDRPDTRAAERRSDAASRPAARTEVPSMPRAPANVNTPEGKLERDRPVPGEVRKDRVLDAAADERKSQAAAAGAPGSAPESLPAPTSGDAVSPLARPPSAAPQRAPSASVRDDFDARPHGAEEWIARIRALRQRGDVHEATRALADFRAAFTDADARLPADLRDWANALR